MSGSSSSWFQNMTSPGLLRLLIVAADLIEVVLGGGFSIGEIIVSRGNPVRYAIVVCSGNVMSCPEGLIILQFSPGWLALSKEVATDKKHCSAIPGMGWTSRQLSIISSSWYMRAMHSERAGIVVLFASLPSVVCGSSLLLFELFPFPCLAFDGRWLVGTGS